MREIQIYVSLRQKLTFTRFWNHFHIHLILIKLLILSSYAKACTSLINPVQKKKILTKVSLSRSTFSKLRPPRPTFLLSTHKQDSNLPAKFWIYPKRKRGRRTEKTRRTCYTLREKFFRNFTQFSGGSCVCVCVGERGTRPIQRFVERVRRTGANWLTAWASVQPRLNVRRFPPSPTRKRKKVGFEWPFFLFRGSTSLLLAARTYTSCLVASAFQSLSLKVLRSVVVVSRIESSICRVASTSPRLASQRGVTRVRRRRKAHDRLPFSCAARQPLWLCLFARLIADLIFITGVHAGSQLVFHFLLLLFIILII